MRIAIFGGTFDPIHRGHVQIARRLTRQFQLDRVLFVTAARPPHKPATALTRASDRHAMVALALRGEKRFVASDIELNSGAEKDFTIDTIARIRGQLRKSEELFFILGADQFAEFGTWRSVGRLLRSVAFVVVSRPGLSLKALVKRCDQKIREAVRPCPQPSRHRGKQRRQISATPPAIYLVEDLKIDISSTVIRARIASGKPVDRLLVAAVADYIRKNGLYR